MTTLLSPYGVLIDSLVLVASGLANLAAAAVIVRLKRRRLP